MTHLVIGATGMLGQALCRELRRRGHETVGAAIIGADRVVDLTDDAQVFRLVGEVAPETIWNAAAIVSLESCERDPGQAYLVNARAVALLAEACIHHHARLVHISSDHFFTGGGAAKHKEDAPVRLLNEYARTKYAGEQFALATPGALVLRTNITGFRRWPEQPTFAEWVFRTVEDDAPVTMFDDFFTSTIDVASFSRAACDLQDKMVEGLLNVSSSEVSSKETFIKTVAARTGHTLSQATIGSVQGIRPARAESLGLDVSRAEAILGYRLPDLTMVVDSLIAQSRGEA